MPSTYAGQLSAATNWTGIRHAIVINAPMTDAKGFIFSQWFDIINVGEYPITESISLNERKKRTTVDKKYKNGDLCSLYPQNFVTCNPGFPIGLEQLGGHVAMTDRSRQKCWSETYEALAKTMTMGRMWLISAFAINVMLRKLANFLRNPLAPTSSSSALTRLQRFFFCILSEYCTYFT